MKMLKFKTTVKCSGCVAAITPFLNEIVDKQNWEVDLQSPDRTLTIAAPKDISDKEIVAAIEKAGFKAERLG